MNWVERENWERRKIRIHRAEQDREQRRATSNVAHHGEATAYCSRCGRGWRGHYFSLKVVLAAAAIGWLLGFITLVEVHVG